MDFLVKMGAFWGRFMRGSVCSGWLVGPVHKDLIDLRSLCLYLYLIWISIIWYTTYQQT